MSQENAVLDAAASCSLNASLIEQTSLHLGSARALAAAVQFGVFTHIAEGKTTPGEIARAAQASERGIHRLLNVLVALGFLVKSAAAYELAPIASQYLVRGRPLYLGHLMEGDWLWESWAHLPEVIRTGKPFRHVDEGTDSAAEFFKALIPTLHVANLAGARRAAGILLATGVPPGGLDVLDIGCGSAVWSIAIAEAAGRGTRVVALDLPSVLELTREYVRLHGLERQFSFLPGDQRELHLGTGRFDLILIARYLHELAAAPICDLLHRVMRALKPGGRVAIADWMPNEERTGPAGPLLYSLRMLLHTDQGDAHTAAEYAGWLRQTGFEGIVQTPAVGTDVPLIVGRRPDSEC